MKKGVAKEKKFPAVPDLLTMTVADKKKYYSACFENGLNRINKTLD